MPWFIVHTERKTLTVYLVEAENAEEATDTVDDSGYLGYFDGETCGVKVIGPFESEVHALEDDAAYVDSR